MLSVSLGGKTEELSDPIALGSFYAVANGVAVVSSAGNDGPNPGTLVNEAPCLFTVAASTIDRDLTSYVGLGDRKEAPKWIAF